jgi:hypothetical protein
LFFFFCTNLFATSENQVNCGRLDHTNQQGRNGKPILAINAHLDRHARTLPGKKKKKIQKKKKKRKKPRHSLASGLLRSNHNL